MLQGSQKEKEKVKSIQIMKKEVKLSLFTDDMIRNVENHNNLIQTHTHTQLLNKFSKDAGYKINMQKSVVFLLCSNKQS